jgi:hypothetical protein
MPSNSDTLDFILTLLFSPAVYGYLISKENRKNHGHKLAKWHSHDSRIPKFLSKKLLHRGSTQW